ncbi:cyclin-dependent protein kinase inhibitor SMR6-like [Forsythia ovata]|uniref:Cyclin-dependent protein kinase inhibitor SMR6-like n=1 Tax=Forsythia ovata TaxID=205694 RepID=A0ABD1WC22_9LAMI
MGLEQKLHKIDGDEKSVGKKNFSTGVNVSLRSPMKPILKEEEQSPRTPTCAESRICRELVCPPAPKKTKTSLKLHNPAAPEFFKLPEQWETVFGHGFKEEAKLT